MKEKQVLADAVAPKMDNRKPFLCLYLILASITGFFAYSFFLSSGETFEATKCGGLLSGDNGAFEYSPPSTGNKPKTCVWLIQAYDSSGVLFTLQAFKATRGSNVVLYKQSEPGQIHLHPTV